MKPLDKDAEIAKSRRNLPHWEQAGCTYFLTWRLADSIPAEKVRGWMAERDRWLALNPKPWRPETRALYNREFVARIERWLDAGHGACVLRQPAVRRVLEGALHFFQGKRYELEAAVIMPNHVHVLVTPYESDTAVPAVSRGQGTGGTPVSRSHSLSSILHSWKSYSAHEIRKLIGQKGPLWMDENFDHAVRSEEQLAHFHRYIRENPAKAALREDEYYLWKRKCDTGFPACDPKTTAEGALLSPGSETETTTAQTESGLEGAQAGRPVSH